MKRIECTIELYTYIRALEAVEISFEIGFFR